MWLVTGHAEVHAAAVDSRLSVDKRHATSAGSAGDAMPAVLGAHLLNSDPPAHTRLRKLVSKAFAPPSVRQLQHEVQRSVDALLDTLSVGSVTDLVTQFAQPLSMSVICDLLGLPMAERRDFRGWTDTLLSPAADAATRSREAMIAMHGYLSDVVARRRQRPGADILSHLVHARDDGAGLTESELVGMCFLLLFGGYHNSASLISTSLLAVLTHPCHLASVRSGELAIEAVTDEALRWNPPTMLSVRRFATEPLRIDGVDIKTGDRVWLSWAAANRDPSVYEYSDRFNPWRPRSTHLAFGHGAHYCLAAALGRLEGNVALRSVVQRFPSIKLAGQAAPEWKPSLRSRSLASLHVTL
ncbi:cytochrome P450 [Streptacidiphilus sp. N1-3]|uniref:Cytochrome P450 n=1 Tax=Streptacidiphilus alkalitolerans TaxID=3342712 RepID=A0ABV6XAV8_9ACTN